MPPRSAFPNPMPPKHKTTENAVTMPKVTTNQHGQKRTMIPKRSRVRSPTPLPPVPVRRYDTELANLLPNCLTDTSTIRPDDPHDYMSQWLRNASNDKHYRQDKRELLQNYTLHSECINEYKEERRKTMTSVRKKADELKKLMGAIADEHKAARPKKDTTIDAIMVRFRQRRQEVWGNLAREMIAKGEAKPPGVRILPNPFRKTPAATDATTTSDPDKEPPDFMYDQLGGEGEDEVRPGWDYVLDWDDQGRPFRMWFRKDMDFNDCSDDDDIEVAPVNEVGEMFEVSTITKTTEPQQSKPTPVEQEQKKPNTAVMNTRRHGKVNQRNQPSETDTVQPTKTPSSAVNLRNKSKAQQSEVKLAESKAQQREVKLAESKAQQSKVKLAGSKAQQSKVKLAGSKAQQSEVKCVNISISSATIAIPNAGSNIGLSKVDSSDIVLTKVQSSHLDLDKDMGRNISISLSKAPSSEEPKRLLEKPRNSEDNRRVSIDERIRKSSGGLSMVPNLLTDEQYRKASGGIMTPRDSRRLSAIVTTKSTDPVKSFAQKLEEAKIDGFLTDKKGRLVDAQGRLIDNKLRLISGDGKLISENGEIIDEVGRKIDEQGNLINEQGRIMDDLGRLLDASDRIINEDGKLLDASDRLIDEEGRLIDSQGKLIDTFGRLIDHKGRLVDFKGRLIDENGRFIDKKNRLVNERGKLINADGLLINERGLLIDDKGRVINDFGQLIDSEGRLINESGMLIDPLGRLVDEWGRLIDSQKRLISQDSMLVDEEGRFVNSDGRLVNAEGQFVDYKGRLVDEYGRLIKSNGALIDSRGRLINDKGKMINADGARIDDRGRLIDESGRLIDEKGRYVDTTGRLIDEEGRLVDDKGRYINVNGRLINKLGRPIDHNGRLIDKRGRLIDQTGRFIDTKGRFVDATGMLVDDRGRTVDEYGRYIDEKGRIIDKFGRMVNEAGHLINEKGQLVSRYGTVVETKEEKAERLRSQSVIAAEREEMRNAEMLAMEENARKQNLENKARKLSLENKARKGIDEMSKEMRNGEMLAMEENGRKQSLENKAREEIDEMSKAVLAPPITEHQVNIEVDEVKDEEEEYETDSEEDAPVTPSAIKKKSVHISQHLSSYMKNATLPERSFKNAATAIKDSKGNLLSEDRNAKASRLRELMKSIQSAKAATIEVDLYGESLNQRLMDDKTTEKNKPFVNANNKLMFNHGQLGVLGASPSKGVLLLETDEQSRSKLDSQQASRRASSRRDETFDFFCDAAYDPDTYVVCDPEADAYTPRAGTIKDEGHEHQGKDFQRMEYNDFGFVRKEQKMCYFSIQTKETDDEETKSTEIQKGNKDPGEITTEGEETMERERNVEDWSNNSNVNNIRMPFARRFSVKPTTSRNKHALGNMW